MARYVMAINTAACLNCKACILACQQRNEVPVGYSRNWVRETNDSAAVLGQNFQPGACMHCDNPPCVAACPTHATYKSKDGSVVIDEDRCIGCGGCIEACPYDARFKNPDTGTADKCDYCRNATPGQVPACVQVCPVHCRIFGDADNPDDPVARALSGGSTYHVRPVGYDTRPTLTYLSPTPENWPQKKEIPPLLAAIGPAASIVKTVGGLALAGVIGVFIKQKLFPSGDASAHGKGEPHD
ncbi:4Fe-4S dicluster domain-containing protein [uncultured Desulfovibrio sp.]|uniref:4Fe-4S dicluster domain-containing protein n=1 Tax=uncultured Desulfovibrio sp. TaxID=167968 RepID=UPI00345DE2B0